MPATPRSRSGHRIPNTTHARRLLSALLALVVVVAGCGGQDDDDPGREDGQPPEEPVTIRMGSFVPGHEVLYIMEHMPEVAPNLGTWYEIDWTPLTAPELARSLASGVLDGTPIAPASAAIAIEQGADLVFTGEYGEFREPNTVVTWLVTSDSGITSAADLEGETVATLSSGSLNDVIQDSYIRTEGGLEPEVDYEKVEFAFPQMQEALLSGQIATGPFASPFLQQALATGEVRPLFDALDVGHDAFVVSVQAFRRDFVESNRVTVEKFMEDWVTVWQWIEDPANRDDVLEVTSEVTSVPVEILDQYMLTDEDVYRTPSGALDVEAVQDTWDFFREEGPLETDLRVEDHIIEELLPPGP